MSDDPSNNSPGVTDLRLEPSPAALDDVATTPVQETPGDSGVALRCGDLVTVNRGKVNLRAWMSNIATVRGVLRKGEQAQLLSDPTHSCGALWVKLSPLESQVASYIAVRYLELVDARAASIPAASTSFEEKPLLAGPYLAGDRFQTTLLVRLRTEPGKNGPIARTVPANMVGTVLGAPVTLDKVDWLPVRLPVGTGWMATHFTKLFGRADKWIEVDLTTQLLTAWDDMTAVSTSPISSGKPGYRTPAGIFTITTKYPARRTVATVKDERWDIPGVPWVMVFREGGFYIHGVYWHDDFGSPVSHGCVTLPVPFAEWLFDWTPSGARLWIHDERNYPLVITPEVEMQRSGATT